MQFGPNEPGQGDEWLSSHPAASLTPYAERHVNKVRDDYSRAFASGQYDEGQLEELRQRMNSHVNRVQRASIQREPAPSQSTLEQQFAQRVMQVDGKLFQRDPQSGNFEVLSEPVKDARVEEEMALQSRIDVQKGRIDLMKHLSSLTLPSADGAKKPMYTPEQIRQEVDRMLPEVNQPASQQPLSPEQFDQQWKKLQSGQSLIGPDGKTYRKR